MAVRRLRVLVVDDSPGVLTALTAVLTAADLVVCGTAGSGATGALLAAELLPDVVLMDVSMPGLDGFGAVTEMRSYGVDAPVVLMSVERTPELLRRAAEVGAAAYVLKTDGATALVEALHRAAGAVNGC